MILLVISMGKKYGGDIFSQKFIGLKLGCGWYCASGVAVHITNTVTVQAEICCAHCSQLAQADIEAVDGTKDHG